LIVVTPPLTITRDEVDEAVDALDDALRLSDAVMDE
jgi:4-aminobutyrate aminotransferase-like enzyme